MDDGLDDLFGDGAPLQLPETLPKGLLQRIDELYLSGCCQKLVWSNNGCIAYISADGRNVVLRHLLCDHNDGRWVMSKEYVVEDVSATHSDHQLVHLIWSHMGNELAIVDVYGRISVWCVQFMPVINRLALVRRCISDPEDNMSAVIGIMWLHIDRPSIFHKPMYKTANGWFFKQIPQRYLGSRSPYQKPALICVTRSGTVRVLFQGQDSRWQEFKSETEIVASPSELLTHAAMCAEGVVEKDNPEKESAILLAMYNSDRELRIYRVRLDFAQSRVSMQHIKVLNYCLPFDEVVNGRNLEEQDALPSHAQLSHLEFIPPGPRTDNKEWVHPFILASFSLLSDDLQGPSAQGGQFTVLCKWQLQHTAPKLHPSFETLSSKKGNASSIVDLPAGYVLKRSKEITVTKTLLSFQQVNVGTALAMSYSDGTVELRDRVTLEILPQDGNDRISSLAQVGFNFPTRGPVEGLHSALSQNACAVVSLDEQHAASMSLLQFEHDYTGGFFDDSLLEVVNAAFVKQYAVASMSSTPSDDCLATMQAFSNQFLEHRSQPGLALANCTNFSSHFLSEFCRILAFPLDYSADAQQSSLISNQYIQRLLSAQASLGFAGEYNSPSLPARVAHTMMNLRYIATSLYTFLRGKSPTESELKNPETVHLLIGMVDWSMALITFVIDEIFMLGDLLEDHGDIADDLALDLLNERIRKITSPALLLMLISSSRAFLKFICNSMRGALCTIIKGQKGSTPLALAYRELDAVFQRAPVTVSQFEILLSHLNTSIKNIYSGVTEADPSLIERDMLVKAEIPAVFISSVREVLTVTAKKLKAEVNVAEIYFKNIGWLGLTDDESSKRWRMQHPIDVMRKVELKLHKPVKRCTRCGSMSEDTQPQRATLVMMTLQRHCLCGGWWIAVGEEMVMGNRFP